RPVDQPRGQRFLFRRPALARKEAAGDLAGGEGLFLVVDGQREEILTGLGRFCRHRGAQNCCFAIGREHRAIGLPGNLAGLEHETASAPVEFFTKDLKHPSSFLSKRTGGTAGGKSSARHTWRAAPYCRNRRRANTRDMALHRQSAKAAGGAEERCGRSRGRINGAIRAARSRSPSSCGVTGCPWGNRAASLAVKARAGMSSSTVSIGSRCPEAARLCPSARAESSEIACFSVKLPTASRRSSTTCPSVPSASARSRARERI